MIDEHAHRRLDRLERLLARQPGAGGDEALQPSYLTVTPAGQIGAVFSGKIQASELDLLAGASPAPIKWITSGGAQVASMQSNAAGDLSFQGNSFVVLGNTVFSAAGSSVFPQNINGARQMQFDYGFVTVNIPANTVAATATAAHGLGLAISKVLLGGNAGNQNIVIGVSQISSPITFRAWWSDGAATHVAGSITASWFAFV